MKKRVYVPEIDKIFESTKAAAAALGVDPGNISKVVSGKRKTAGGYHFINANPAPGKTRRPSKKQLRRQAGDILPPDPLAAIREELRKALDAANKQIKRLNESGFGGLSGAKNELLALTDVFGQTESGYISAKNINRMSQAELEKNLKAIRKLQKRRSYGIGGAIAEADRLAQTFGTTADRIAELSDALPFLFSALNSSKEYTSDLIRDLADDVFNDPDATAQDLINELAALTDYYDKSAALTSLLKSDAHLLDQYGPIRNDLEALLAASREPEFKDSLAAQIDDISDMILNNIGSSNPEAANEYIGDLIRDELSAIGYFD